MLGLNQIQKSNQMQSNQIGEVIKRSENLQSVRNGENGRNYKHKRIADTDWRIWTSGYKNWNWKFYSSGL